MNETNECQLKEKVSILFAYPNLTPFVRQDIDLLGKHFAIKTIKGLETLKTLKSHPLRKIALKIKMIPWLYKSDVCFIWFAEVYAVPLILLSKIFKKKVVVVVGGWEVAKVPEIKYGCMTSKVYAPIVKFILRYADKVLALSKSHKKEILRCKGNKTENVKLVYCGVDIHRFEPKNKKEDLVITVSYVTKSNLKRKGLEYFVKVAKHLPNIKFMLIGAHIDNSIRHLRKIAPSNVEFTGFISIDELIRYYQRAKVYVQISAHEGFGLAMAEAMLCECVPVVTKKGAIPEVVGTTGIYVPYGEIKATVEGIKEALTDNKRGKRARERIKNIYPLEKREKELVEIIKELI